MMKRILFWALIPISLALVIGLIGGPWDEWRFSVGVKPAIKAAIVGMWYVGLIRKRQRNRPR